VTTNQGCLRVVTDFATLSADGGYSQKLTRTGDHRWTCANPAYDQYYAKGNTEHFRERP